MCAYFIRSFRWNLLLRKQIKLTAKESWFVSSAGNWINYLIPIRAGEIIKALLIKRIKNLSAVSVLPSVFIDKFFDTIGIFFIQIMIPVMQVNVSHALQILIILLIVMFAIVFGILILAATRKRTITAILQVIFAWLPDKTRQKINNLIELFINGLNIFEHHHTIILYAVLLTALGLVFDGMYFYLLFRAFHQNLSFMIVLFGYTLINLSYILPQPPAQLGSNEWMMIIIFSLGFGFDKNIASSIMVFAHIFATLIITGLGIIGFSYAGVRSVKQIEREL
jgi:glycosyltransferase 2 family protein